MFTVNELAAVGFGAAKGNFFAQLGKAQLLQFFLLFEEPQTFPQNFTLGLVVAGFEEIFAALNDYPERLFCEQHRKQAHANEPKQPMHADAEELHGGGRV